MLHCSNNKQKQYNDVLSKIPYNFSGDLFFNKSGKLIICLIEFRQVKEIKYVMYALLRSYKPEEIGIAFMYGNKNKKYIEDTFKNWKNVVLIHKNFDNIDRRIYSALMKQPQYYEYFSNWSHVLVYQTDALLLRKIDDIYFEYDYIGAPWIESNQWCKYNAGNGGFSLRNVKSCIRICEQYRNLPFEKIPQCNEDGFFCSQDSFKYPIFNTELHKAFSVERVNYKTPIGVHQIYHNFNMSGNDWKEFIQYMRETLIENKKPSIDIQKLLKLAKEQIERESIRLSIIEKIDAVKVSELLNQEQKIGSFTLNLTHKAKNRWSILCDYDYEILFCANNNPDSVVKTHKINKAIEANIHKKESGCYYLNKENFIYIIFYPGFPNGGESWADINAGGHFGHCRELPKDGAIILKAPLKSEFVSPLNTAQYNISHIKENILAFDLFSGVGYYNQLFSLEQAVYMAAISKRYLILNIKHPLAACGVPKREYGLLTDFLDNKYKEYLVGFEVRDYKNFVDPVENEIAIPSKISNCIIVDSSLDKPENANEIKDFAHCRTILKERHIQELFNSDKNVVYFNKTNASRVFTNFYTTPERYDLMNKIANSLSKYNPVLTEICEQVKTKIDKEFISIHLRMGDWHKSINNSQNQKIINNISNWLDNNNSSDNLPIYIMTDKNDNPLFKNLSKWKLVFVESFITEDIIKVLKQYFKNTTVAEFLIQKYILEQSKKFIGSQGSTCSAHINYNNYLSGKPYEHVTTSSCNTFDIKTLKHNDANKNKYSWKRKNFMGGHPLAWSMFFEDNIVRGHSLNPDIKVDLALSISSSSLNNESVGISVGTVSPTINNSEPFLAIDFWLFYSNVIIDATNKNGKENYSYKTELEAAMKREKSPIIFLKTDLLPNYIDILQSLNKPFILITSSNDDHCPPYLYYPENDKEYPELKVKTDRLLNESNLKVWYAKNPAINHRKLKPYPLGPKWQWKTTRFMAENKAEHLRIYNTYGLEPDKNMHNQELKVKLLYFNFNQTTNNPLYKPHKNIRHKAKSDLMKNGFKWNESEEFENYIRTLSTYKFCVAPPGRGIDSHRCWEALMVGTIPIVISSSINELYEGLPVIIVNNWDIITHEFLNKKYDEMIKISYNFEKVYSEYWLKKVQEYQI